jgi:hypothetical protein
MKTGALPVTFACDEVYLLHAGNQIRRGAPSTPGATDLPYPVTQIQASRSAAAGLSDPINPDCLRLAAFHIFL